MRIYFAVLVFRLRCFLSHLNTSVWTSIFHETSFVVADLLHGSCGIREFSEEFGGMLSSSYGQSKKKKLD